MTMTAAPGRRRSQRDSEADVETEIYVRPQGQPMAWDRVMVLQIMKDLETRLPRVVPPPRLAPARVAMTKGRRSRVTPVPPPGEPNVFLMPWTPADPMPPWSTVEAVPAASARAAAAAGAAQAVKETLLVEGRRRKVRTVQHTRVPWLLFVMAFGIAFGIGQDRQLRRELGTKLRATTTHAAAIVARRVSSAF